MTYSKLPLFILTFLATINASARKDYLAECWKKQVAPLQQQYLCLSYTEKLCELQHNFQPWQQTVYTGRGKVWCNGSSFLRQDTLVTGKRSLFSKTVFHNGELLLQDYGQKDLSAVNPDMILDQSFNTARYSPVAVISYFAGKQLRPGKESNGQFAVYETTINKTKVRLYIEKTTSLAAQITTLNDDELFGDVLTTIVYRDYAGPDGLFYPATVQIGKINGKLRDTVTVSGAEITKDIPALLERPADYALKPLKVPVPELTGSQYSSHIHFLELKHSNDKVMIVEFADFLLVAEAPLNSANGELILAEADKIAPGKPVRYFAFGHHHPHYLGGLRPFVHRGAKIICTPGDEEYVSYLVRAPHSLVPDSLQLQPKPLQLEMLKDSMTISDGSYAMRIFFIGKKSEHTNDYLVYYFPEEKLLFEDDLVWIVNGGTVQKAGPRQAGLYKAVKELGLDIRTVIQSWPVTGYGVKTVIPFAELEASMKVE